MRRRYADVYIGFFVLAGLAVAGYMIIKFGGVATRKGYEVTVLFNDIAGLIKEAPVRYMGYECGKVREIDIIPWGAGRKVKVVLSIDRQLRVEDEFRIVPLGLLGEKFVKVVPGPFDADPLPEGARVEGTDPEELLDPLRDIFGPLAQKETQERIASILQSFSESVPILMWNLNQLTGEGMQMPLRDTVESLSLAVNDFRSVLADFKAGVKTVTGAGQEAQRLLAENREQVSGLIASTDQTLKNFDRIADDLYPIVADIRAGRGGLGRFITDPGWYTNFSKILLGLRTHGVVHLEDALKEEQDQAKRRPPEPTVRVW